MCLPCAESQELPNGDITGKLKANNEIRRDAATAAAAKYERLYSNVDNSIRAHVKALAVAKPISQSSLLPSTRKILNMTSRQVSSLPARDVVIWFFTREESDHYITCKKAKVLLSNWKIVTEQLTGVPSIPMSVRQLDRIPLTSMMQQHQKILQIMSNGKFNCTSEMFSQIMECFCVTPYSIFCKCSLTA